MKKNNEKDLVVIIEPSSLRDINAFCEIACAVEDGNRYILQPKRIQVERNSDAYERVRQNYKIAKGNIK